MEIGGHPPIPLAQNNCPLWHFPSYFSTVFWVPNFRGRFEALNEIFWRFGGQMVTFDMNLAPIESCKARIYLSNGISSTQIEYRMQKI